MVLFLFAFIERSKNMEYVMFITRDVNGERKYHYGSWDDVGNYIQTDDVNDEDEILMITVNA